MDAPYLSKLLFSVLLLAPGVVLLAIALVIWFATAADRRLRKRIGAGGAATPYPPGPIVESLERSLAKQEKPGSEVAQRSGPSPRSP